MHLDSSMVLAPVNIFGYHKSIRKRNVPIGTKFNRLTVLKEIPGIRRTFICRCECGAQTETLLERLTGGITKSCGCIAVRHGMSDTKFHNIWMSMRSRCGTPSCSGYKNYGGRGIKVENRWDKFENFYDDMFEGYAEGLTIDRIDNNGNYGPMNCRWITVAEQNRNCRSNVFITFNGKTQCKASWARELGIHINTLDNRIKMNGVDTAFRMPLPIHK